MVISVERSGRQYRSVCIHQKRYYVMIAGQVKTVPRLIRPFVSELDRTLWNRCLALFNKKHLMRVKHKED